jgi:7-carboxy-7-deazaguanine synthase (Cx14CxxC type)
MSYAVKEIFYTLQGEGAQAGRAAVFCRFAGCNLWSGREEDRASAICRFCDTDFVGTEGLDGGRFADAEALATRIEETWARGAANAGGSRFVVMTGGEPLLQIDDALIAAVHAHGFQIAVETNGTIAAPGGLDWICVSPKANAPLVQRSGDELKLVFLQLGAEPERFAGMDFRHFFLQPMDGPRKEQNTEAALAYCLQHPQWRLSIQMHKLVGIR